MYFRDGHTADAGHNLNEEIGRPKSDRIRVYLAGAGDALRGRSGFVAQVNYRPHNENSFAYADTDGATTVSNPYTVSFAGDSATFWFVELNTGLLYKDEEILLSSTVNGPMGLVVQSLHASHVVLARVDNTSTVSLSYEVTAHYEGVADNANLGFHTFAAAELMSASSPL